MNLEESANLNTSDCRRNYIPLGELKVYLLAQKLSAISWEIYKSLSIEHKKIVGSQFIRSVDSNGANIAEGYGRFHPLDQVNFYYYARASMNEAVSQWASLMCERDILTISQLSAITETSRELEIRLNNFITTTRKCNAK